MDDDPGVEFAPAGDSRGDKGALARPALDAGRAHAVRGRWVSRSKIYLKI